MKSAGGTSGFAGASEERDVQACQEVYAQTLAVQGMIPVVLPATWHHLLRKGGIHTLGLAILAFSCVEAHAQYATPPVVAWSFTATASTYVVPDRRNYFEGVITADRRWLHLEGRYNYEEMDSGSAWVGYNFNIGSKVLLQVTPMVGVVFGSTTGIAPGQRITVNWRQFELYSEDEVVFSTRTLRDSFFYTWSELTWSPSHWLRMGVVGQRTRAYRSERDLQRGFLVGFEHKRIGIVANALNPDRKAVFIVSAHVEF